MNDFVARPTSMGRLAVFYVIYHAFALVVLAAIFWAIDSYTSLDSSSSGSAMGILIPLLCAMQAGSHYYERTRTLPSKGFRWRVALMFTAIAIAISAALLWLWFSTGLLAEELPELRNGMDSQFLMIAAGVLAFLAVVLLFVHRFAFGMGLRQGEKYLQAQQKKAARKAGSA
ncbi:MAG: ABZJ_00895 family protein [Paracoccus sp. (in: a-proteobacteria)]|nr:ABZJ_00895 family protein [Paracoccus sp. (in: a-proteobacteria)]